MNKINNIDSWRTTVDVIALIPVNSKEVYLVAPEKKQYISIVSRNISEKFSEIYIDSNSFSLKISENGEILINSEKLPNTESWYSVKNFKTDNLFRLINELKIDKGNFEKDVKFEAIFSEKYPELVSFTTEQMSTYKSCFEEMKRRINCEIYSKTTKWIPGHRYDTLTSTIYYLGDVFTRKSSMGSSGYLDTDKMITVSLYVTDIKDNEKTISDIFRNRIIGSGEDDINISYTKSSMVDSGESLINDNPVVEDFLEDIFDRSIQKNTVSDRLTNLVPALNVFSIQSQKSELKISNSLRQKLEEAIKSTIFENFINFWNINKLRSELCIGTGKTLDENIESEGKLFYVMLRDENVTRNIYYTSLFDACGINFTKIVEDSVNNWNEADLYVDFDTYLKYIDYFEYRSNNPITTQRVKSTSYTTLEVVKVSDIFGSGALSEALIDILNYTRDNYGMCSRNFNIINIGTKKDPKQYIDCVITIDNVINYFKGVVPEPVKEEIIRFKFTSLAARFDNDREIE